MPPVHGRFSHLIAFGDLTARDQAEAGFAFAFVRGMAAFGWPAVSARTLTLALLYAIHAGDPVADAIADTMDARGVAATLRPEIADTAAAAG